MPRLFGALLLTACAAGCQRPATTAGPGGPPPSLTRANFEKVREGMTLPEVEAILGPPGATSGVDVKRPDGAAVKDVQSASWFWSRATVSPDSKRREEGEKRIVIRLKDGKVTSKEQVGLE